MYQTKFFAPLAIFLAVSSFGQNRNVMTPDLPKLVKEKKLMYLIVKQVY